MSANLAHWLTEHQMLLLPRWIAATHVVLPTNGHSADTMAADVVVDSETTPDKTRLEQLYEALVLAANGSPDLLNEQLQVFSSPLRSEKDVFDLHSLIQIIHQFRRLAWEIFRREEHDSDHLLELMYALEDILDYTTDTLSELYVNANQRAMQIHAEEANFIAESMNEAIEQADRTAMQLSSLNEVSQHLSSSLEGSASIEIISYVGSKLLEILQVAHVAIWLPEDHESQFDSRVVLCAVQVWGQDASPVPDLQFVPTSAQSLPADIVLRAFVQAQTVTVFEPLDPAQQGAWYLPDCGVIALPLLVKEQAIGVVALQDQQAIERFGSAQQDTLRSIVTQAAIALNNTYLYAKVRRFNNDLEQLVEQRTHEVQAEKERLQTVHDISVEVSSTLDLDLLLHTSLEMLAHITRVEYGSIMLVDRETDNLVNRAVLGKSNRNKSFTRFPLGQGVAGWVAQHKEPALIPDITQDERWVELPSEEPERKVGGSMVSVPLTVQNETMGVLTLSHKDVNYFNTDHLRLLTASAGAIAIGINNANLYTAIVDDMEHRSELLRHQQMETSKTEAILQSLADGVLVCGTEGEILSVNQACSDMLQRSVEELMFYSEVNLHDLIIELLGDRTHELPLAELLRYPLKDTGDSRIYESTVTLNKRVISITLGSVMRNSDELIGALMVMHDKTREVESDRLKTEFIGTMSHELRTPMTSIKGFTQLLALGSLGPVNDTQREFLDTIQTNAERMISVINDVLELTKIETGSIELEIRSLHLAEVLSGVVAELQGLITSRNHELSITIPPGLPLVRADSNRLHQILYNILANAIKYTDKGGTIRVEAYEANRDDLPQHVRECVITQQRYTRIDVHDTGVGIAEHELERVFDRFYRTENPLKVEAGGTGLGLSLTRPLLELLGGRIWAKSALQEGTTFSFILPAVEQRS